MSVSTSMRGYLGPSAYVSGPGRLRRPLLVPCRLRTVMVHEPVLSPHHAALGGIPISLETPAQVMESVDEAVAAQRAGGCVAITNTESMYHAWDRSRPASVPLGCSA